jgi:hypothetical protein
MKTSKSTNNTMSETSTIASLDFSDLKTVRENLTISGSENTTLIYKGIELPFKGHIIESLIRAGFYHSTADETAKVKAGTEEKSAAIKDILARWADGYFTAKDRNEANRAMVVPSTGKVRTPAYGRNEILGCLSDNALVSDATITTLRGYDDRTWSVFLIKNMDNAALKSAYSLLAKEAADKATAEFESIAADVIEL